MEGGLLGKEGEKKGDKPPQRRPERDVQKTNKRGRSGRETTKTTLTAPRDRVTNKKQLQREVGRGGQNLCGKKIVLNTKKEKEVLFSAVPGCLQVPSACRLGWGLLLPELCPIC